MVLNVYWCHYSDIFSILDNSSAILVTLNYLIVKCDNNSKNSDCDNNNITIATKHWYTIWVMTATSGFNYHQQGALVFTETLTTITWYIRGNIGASLKWPDVEPRRQQKKQEKCGLMMSGVQCVNGVCVWGGGNRGTTTILEGRGQL